MSDKPPAKAKKANKFLKNLAREDTQLHAAASGHHLRVAESRSHDEHQQDRERALTENWSHEGERSRDDRIFTSYHQSLHDNTMIAADRTRQPGMVYLYQLSPRDTYPAPNEMAPDEAVRYPPQHPPSQPSSPDPNYYSFHSPVYFSPSQTFYHTSTRNNYPPISSSPYYPVSPHQHPHTGGFYPQPSAVTNQAIFFPYPQNPNPSYSSLPSNDNYPSVIVSTNDSQPARIFASPIQHSYPSNPVYLSTQFIPNHGTPTTQPRRSPPSSTSPRATTTPRPKVTGTTKKSKNKNKSQDHMLTSFSSLKNHVLEIAVDQTKCRELQEFLRDGGSDGTTSFSPVQVLNLIFDEIRQHAFTIVVNPFGNYLFQVVYELSPLDHKVLLLESLASRLADASCNKHGSRCVQHMIGHSVYSSDLISLLVQYLQPHILRLCIDENGNHVVQYCLEKLTVDQNNFIFDLITTRCLDICKQRYGNRVMQRCIKCAVDGQCADFTELIVSHSFELITDEFGNYIIQHMLAACPHHIPAICQSVIGRITLLSKQKHASVVVEKCFESGSPEIQSRYIEEIILPENLGALIQDQFGNYVLQNALKYLPSELKHQLVENLLKFIDLIKAMPWGLQIISKMCSDSTPPSSSLSPATTTTTTNTSSSL